MAVRSLAQVVIWPGQAWPLRPRPGVVQAPTRILCMQKTPSIQVYTWPTKTFPMRHHMGRRASSHLQTCIFARIHTRVFAPSVALKQQLNQQGPHCRSYCGISTGPPFRLWSLFALPESTFSRITRILLVSARPSVLGPWRSSPRGSRDRSTNGRGVHGKPHAKSLPHTPPCHVISHVAMSLPGSNTDSATAHRLTCCTWASRPACPPPGWP